MNISPTFKAKAAPPKLMQPGQGPLHDPAIPPQATAMRPAPPSDPGLDRAVAQRLAMEVRVVAPIRIQLFRTAAGSSPPTAHRRNGLDDRQQVRDGAGIGGGQSSSEWNALRIRNNVVFRAGFRPVGGVRTGSFPPKTARTDALSTAARDQSIWSLAWSLTSNAACNFCHTPACSPSVKRRQQVMPDPQPISWGRSSQAMPVLSTNKIPVSALRLSKGLRPGFFFRRGFTGINGSRSSHKVSSMRGFVIPQS